MRIKIRLTILFISIVLIPMLFIGAISYLSARNALEQTTLAGLHAVSEFMEGKIFLYLDKLKTRTLDFSSDGYIRDSLAVIAGQDKKQRVEELNFHLLNNKKPLNKDILRIDVLNINGEVVASTDPQKINTDNHKEKYFIKGKKEIYVTDVHKEADGRIVLKVSTSLKDRVDPTKIIGVIVNYYDAMPLNDLFTGEATLKMGAKTQSIKIGKTDETYLVNQEELMVTSSLFIKNAVFNQKVATYPVRKGLQDNEEVMGIWPDYRGIPVIGSSMIIDMGDFKWVLLSEQDVAEAFAPIYNLRKSLIIFGVIVMFLVSLVALSISQSISKPIHALHKGAEIIEGGNLDYKVGTDEKDEIGQLSRAFDNMVESLKKRNTELEMEIAERKKAEEELRKLSNAVEQSPNTVVITDTEGNIEYVNPKFVQLAGYTLEEVKGKNPSILKSGHHSEEFYKGLWKVIISGNVWKGEFLNKAKDDSLYWVSASVAPIKDQEGSITHFVDVAEDITGRKKTEAELEKYKNHLEDLVKERTKELHRAKEDTEATNQELKISEERFRSLVANIPGAVYRCDLDEHLTFRYISDYIESVTGYPANEFLGNRVRSYANIIYPEDTEMVDRAVRDGVRKDGSFTIEYRIVHADGTVHWVFERGQAVMGKDDTVEFFDGFILDVTERKNAEKELRKAKETAEEATQSKSDFLSNMSHEIRTPLNAIVGNIYLLQRTNLALKQKEYVESMNQASDSLLGVINDILDFSKIESGNLDMESADFYLDDVLTKLAGILIITKQKKPLELLFYTSQDVPLSLVGDSLRLGQILTNLANNAIKFTEEGEVTILTEIYGKKNGGVTLKFSVKDTGIGMTEDQMTMLFEPFRQVDTSTTREYGGTGLGLTICKKLVEMMNGKIWVESKPGIGSTFSFTADFGQNEEELKKEYSLPTDFKDRSVLVVDDNLTVREILKKLIESFGFRVTVTGSGEEALDILGDASADKAFNLVLMDWKMPGMDGVAVTRGIRNLTLETRDSEGQISIIPHPVSTIPIIMITGYGQEDLSQLTKGLNLKSIIYKPFTRSTLFDAIIEVFIRKTAKEVWSKDKPARDLEGIRQISGARILLVEDNEINQKVASELLESVGLSVTIAKNGQEAVQAVARESFDAVLMDIQMPVMDGFEATAQIRKFPKASGQDKKIRSVPIIAMTAHAMAGDRKKSLKAGMNDHVTKPIDPNQLFATLVKWIEPGERETPSLKKEILSTEDDVDLPVSLPGIDIEDGLIRVGGNRGLFRKLLIEFSLSNKNTVEEIQSVLESKDRKKATRLAHTLRGLAGNLGAHELQTAAADIEAAITAESEELNDILERMSATLKHVIFGITSLEEGKPEDRATDAGPIEAVDISTVAPLLDELSALLKKNDMQSENLFEKIKDDLHKMQPDKTRQIEKHLSDLNFKDALKDLKDIMDSLNIDGSRTNSVEPT